MKIMMNSGRIKVFFTTRKKLVNSIKNRGYVVTIAGFEKENKHLCDENNLLFEFIPFERAGLNPLADFNAYKTYYDVIKREKYDIVHSYTAKPNIYASIAAKRAGVKRIFPTVNGLGYAFTDTSNSFKSKAVRFIISRLYKRAFDCATKVFFQNPDDADEMVKRGLIKRDKCVLISGSGIDLDMFPYSDVQVKPMTFFIATRLLVTKGIRNYFEAAKIVKQKYPHAIFRIAGELDPNPDGIKKKELEAYIADGTIEFLGYVKDMPLALKECSVFVLPSYYREGVPHTVLEAMSIGRAIITCNTPGCKETVREVDTSGRGKNGFLLSPKNSRQLADTMIWMIEHPNQVKEMGKESRKYAEERFDVEKVNKIMMETMGI